MGTDRRLRPLEGRTGVNAEVSLMVLRQREGSDASEQDTPLFAGANQVSVWDPAGEIGAILKSPKIADFVEVWVASNSDYADCLAAAAARHHGPLCCGVIGLTDLLGAAYSRHHDEIEVHDLGRDAAAFGQFLPRFRGRPASEFGGPEGQRALNRLTGGER